MVDAATLGTVMLSISSLTIPPSGGSTTWGVGPTLTPTALADTPNASPPTLLKMAFVVVAPASSPIVAKRGTYRCTRLLVVIEKRHTVVQLRAGLTFLSL